MSVRDSLVARTHCLMTGQEAEMETRLSLTMLKILPQAVITAAGGGVFDVE